MNILIIDGLIKSNGHTDKLLDKHIASLKASSITRIVLRDSNISHCTDCGGCGGSNGCIILDDMQKIFDASKLADYCIIASPVVFGNTTAYVQTALSRFQSMYNGDFSVLPKVGKLKKGAIIITAGGSGGGTEAVIKTMRLFLKMLNVSDIEIIANYNTDK